MGEIGGRPGLSGWYLYWFFSTFSICERLIFAIIFLRLALLFLFHLCIPKQNEKLGGL